jgi:hypothetical protein
MPISEQGASHSVCDTTEYVAWQGKQFEGQSVKPDIEVRWSPIERDSDADNRLERALEALRDLFPKSYDDLCGRHLGAYVYPISQW